MKKIYFVLSLVFAATFLISCSEDDPVEETPTGPTSNYFTFGDQYFELTHGAVAYYGENDYDFFFADGSYDDENISKYMYFDLGSLSEEYVGTGTYSYANDYERTPGTFVDGEFWANAGESTISSSGKNPFDKGSKSARTIAVDDNYYGITGGTIDVEHTGENQYTINFSVSCKLYDENWDLTGETVSFSGNFSGAFEYLDYSAEDVWLYVQFYDSEDETLLYPNDFDTYYVYLYESEDDFLSGEYAIEFSDFYDEYEGIKNVFEFYELNTETDYIIEAYFEDAEGYYSVAGYLGSTLEEGDNFYTVYVDYYGSDMANLYLQFIDIEDESYILSEEDFGEVLVYMYESESDFLNDENGIEYDDFYTSYDDNDNVFEFTYLNNYTNYWLAGAFVDSDGFYYAGGDFGLLDSGNNFYYIYVSWYDAKNGQKQVKIEKVEKRKRLTVLSK